MDKCRDCDYVHIVDNQQYCLFVDEFCCEVADCECPYGERIMVSF